MRDNYTRLVGKVKRSSNEMKVREGLSALNFCLDVPSDGSRGVYVDCIAYGEPVEQLEGFVEEGEVIAVEGHISFRTYTDSRGIRKTSLYVHVESAYAESAREVEEDY